MTDITIFREALLATLPTDGCTIGNHSLLRDTLLPRLISGQLRLAEVEELIEEARA